MSFRCTKCDEEMVIDLTDNPKIENRVTIFICPVCGQRTKRVISAETGRLVRVPHKSTQKTLEDNLG